MDEVKKPLRELNNFEVLLQAVTIYKSHFIEAFTPMLVSSVLTSLIVSVASIYIPFQATFENNFNVLISQLKIFFIITLLVAIVGWVLNMVAGGIVIKYTSSLLEGKTVGLIEAFKVVAKKLFVLLAASIISGLLIGVGFMALVIPGIIFSIIFFLFIPVIIVEEKGVISSLKRSKKLVAKRWMKTFGLMLILTIIVGATSFITGAIQSILGKANIYISFLISSIISALVAPIYFVSLTIYYYSMLVKEQILPQQALITFKEVKYCIQCGARIPINANFCPICGAKQTQV
jgi:hypothetical protein